MEALRFPWSEDERRREVAPSAFRPHKRRHSSRSHATRSHATRGIPRRGSDRVRTPSLWRPRPTEPPGDRPGRVGAGHARREGPHDRTAGRVVQGPQRERHEPDYVLMAVAVALAAIGILMVYSSSGYRVAITGHSVFDAVAAQLGWALLGGIAMVVMMRIDYRYWRSFSILGMVVAIVLLVLVVFGPEVPPLLDPVSNYGATRWLRIGGLPTFQPSEVAKMALVIFLAHWLAARGKEVGSFRRGMLPFVLLIGLISGLVLLQPDLGTTGVLVLTAFTMLFVAGGSILQMAGLMPLGLAAVAVVVMNREYMLNRVLIFLDPFKDPRGDGYQTVQGITSLAFGGVTGRGLGESQTTGVKVPAAENDFIFAVLGQEFGFLGGIFVIGLFLLLAWRGMRVAMHAPDTFGGLVALGITAWLTFQALINIGVVVSLIPMTGMPLPFLSEGGTSLVVVLTAVGILLSISRETVTRGADQRA